MTTKLILHAILVFVAWALLPAPVVQGQEPVPQTRFRCTVLNVDGAPVSNLRLSLGVIGPTMASLDVVTGVDGSFEVQIPVSAAGLHGWELRLARVNPGLDAVEKAIVEEVWSTTAKRVMLGSGRMTLPSAEPVTVSIRLERRATVSGTVIVQEAEQSRPLQLQVDKSQWQVPGERLLLIDPAQEPNGRWRIDGLPSRAMLPLIVKNLGTPWNDLAFVIVDTSSGSGDFGTITIDRRQLPEWPEVQISAVNVPPELANEPLAALILDMQGRTFRNLRRFPGQAFFSMVYRPGETLRLPPGQYRFLVRAPFFQVVSLIASGTPIPESVAPTVTVVAGQPATLTVDWKTFPGAFGTMFPYEWLEPLDIKSPVDTHLDIKLNDTRETYKDPTLRNPLPSPPLPPPDKKTVPEPGKP